MIMDEATERRIFALMKSVGVHDPEDEHVVISADGIGKGILRGNTIHLTQPLAQLLLRIVCSWCNTTMRDGAEPTSHSMCQRCQALSEEEQNLQVDYIRAMRQKELATDPPSE